MADRSRGTMRSEWRENWRAGVAVTLTIALGYTVWPSVASLFIQPLEQAFAWSRGQIAFAYNAGLISSLLAPWLGSLVDHAGPRPVLLTGLAVVATFYVLLAGMPNALWLYYAASLVLAIFGMATSAVSYTRVIVGIFRNTRGTALAITRGGFAVSVALLPALLFQVMERWGFRAAFLTLALLIALIALPAVWFWTPHRDTSLQGLPSPETLAPERIRTLLRSDKRIVIICLAAAFNYAPVFAVISQLKPLAMEKGLPSGIAVAMVSAMGFATLSGAVVSGVLIDRLWAPGVAFVLNLLAATGCVLLFLSPTPVSFAIGILLIGLGQGAEIDIVAFILARWFGMRSYATLYGLTAMCIGGAAAICAALIGATHDWTGSYQIALACGAVSFVIAALLYLLMGRAPQPAC